MQQPKLYAACGGSTYGLVWACVCRCKIVGPTCGLVVGVVAAVICWPLGVIVRPLTLTSAPA